MTWIWIVASYTVTFNLETEPSIKVMTHSKVIDNDCVKYYTDPKYVVFI